MPKQKIPSVSGNTCPKHDKELINYFCNKHNVNCCPVCVTLYHSQCQVLYIDDVAKEFHKSQEYKEVFQSCRDIKKCVEDSRKVFQNNSDAAKTCVDKLMADLNQFRTEINTKLDELEKELKQEAETIQTDVTESTNSFSTLCENIETDLTEITSNLKSLEMYKQNQQLFISTKKAQGQIQVMQKILTKCVQEIGTRPFKFKRNENITKMLNSVSAIGDIQFESNTEMKEEIKPKSETTSMKDKASKLRTTNQGYSRPSDHDRMTSKMDSTPSKSLYLEAIDIKRKQDSLGCWITGIAQINTNKLAVIDANNRAIKMADLTSNSVTTEYEFDETPFDVTHVRNCGLVVSCTSRLVYLQYDGKLKLSFVKKVNMLCVCRGITSFRDKLFVICEESPKLDCVHDGQTSVKILSDEGVVLQTIRLDERGLRLFNPQYIAISKNGQRIFVSDGKQNSVTTLNLNGKICHVYTHEDLKYPRGLTVDDLDNVYVAGRGSHNVHQMTPLYASACIVQKDSRVQHPFTILYSTTNNSLYISAQNFLHVYKLY